jgi:hypothetical protein
VIEILVERALSRLPEPLRSRYDAEWRADLAAFEGRRWAALRWAIGLQRASVELRREVGGKRPLIVPRLVLDALALGLAYYLAYALRFGGDPPPVYREQLAQTLPVAVLGGVVCMALAGVYSGGLVRVFKGVALTTLSVIAYAALVRPNLGDPVLNLPAGVCVIFAMAATALLVATRLASAAGAAVVARR